MSLPQETAPNYNASGWQLALVLPALSATGQMQKESKRESEVTNFESAYGLALGYANFPVRRLGYVAGLGYLAIDDGETRNGLLRADANVAYALDGQLYGKGGLNLSKWTTGYLSTFNLAMGFQGGIGYRFTRNFGVEAGYTIMKQQQPQTGGVTVQGGELSLTGTF